MEKILVVVDSQNLNLNTICFACYLSRLTQSSLTAVFLDEPIREEKIICEQLSEALNVESIVINDNREEDDMLRIREQNINQLREIAREEMVGVFVHLDKGVPTDELIAETRFADVLIMNAATSFSGFEENIPTRFVKNILQDAGCPVIISPETFNGIDNIIFCYDGSKSSLFAIKQFSHLFPELKNKPIKIIYLNNEEDLDENEKCRITEWLTYHYNNNIEWIITQLEAKLILLDYLVKKRDDFVVMGAYGKGLLTSFFKEDRHDGIRKPAIPIFVSHF
jgi:hypothetical protein